MFLLDHSLYILVNRFLFLDVVFSFIHFVWYPLSFRMLCIISRLVNNITFFGNLFDVSIMFNIEAFFILFLIVAFLSASVTAV